MSSQTIQQYGDIETVADLDFHLIETEEDLLPYLEEPYESMLSRDGVAASHYNPTKFFLDGVDGEEGPEATYTKAEVKSVMEEMGIDRVTLNPGTNLNLVTVHNDDYAVALASAYNEWVTDTFLDASEGMYGSMRFSPRYPERAAEEIEKWADHDAIVGAILGPPGYMNSLGHPRMDPIYEALEDNGLPLLIHNSVLSLQHVMPGQFEGMNTFMEARGVGHPVGQMNHLANLIVGGVPERFSDLDIVIMESGLGWIPYMTRRLDYYYSARREDAPDLKKPPSEYFDSNFYVTTQPIEGSDDPSYVQQIIEWIGPDNIMFASDYPHSDFDFADALFNNLRDGFEPSAIEKVYGGNAMEALDY